MRKKTASTVAAQNVCRLLRIRKQLVPEKISTMTSAAE
jgi:hypothetical protein